MNNKKSKYYLKCNLIGLIAGGIIFGSLGVYAAITFSSNEVSFDPSNSTLTSTNVQSAIDELYKKCTNPPASETILKDAGLEKDPYECRYFFTGANPNNYITFNEENDGKAGWRILSIECDGKIKIVRNKDINRAWDSSNVSAYNNDWSRPSTLNTYLNGEYYNEILTSANRGKIVSNNFYIGDTHMITESLEEELNLEYRKTWYGKIALPSLSEYIRTNSNKSQCNSTRLYNQNFNTCKTTTWMHKNTNWRTLNPYYDNWYNVFSVNSNGEIIAYARVEDESYEDYPTLYLSADIVVTGGDGSQNNPYEVS